MHENRVSQSVIVVAVRLLDRRRRIQLALVTGLSFLVGALEAVGAGLVLALLNVALADEGAAIELPVIGDPTAWFGDRSRDSVVLILCAVFAAFFIVRGLVFLLSTYVQHRFIQMTAVQLGRRLIRGYFHLPFQYHVGANSAELLRNAYLNVQQLARTVYKPIVDILAAGIIALLLVAVLVVASPVPVAVAAALLGLVLFLALRLVQNRLKAAGRATQQASRDALQAALEGLRGIRDLKTFGVEDYFVERFTAQREIMARAAWRKESLKELPRVILESVLLLSVLALLAASIVAGRDAPESLASIGLLAYVGIRLLPPLQSLAAGVNDLEFTTKAMDEVVSDIARFGREGETRSLEGPQVELIECLDVRGVGFTYHGAAEPALRGLTLEIGRGERLGICGRSGGGKTTLLDLLSGLLSPTSGELVVDGRPFDPADPGWRRNVAVVSQDVFLLDDSIERNVALGIDERDTDSERVWAALEAAQLAEHVRASPDGLETRIGEGGLRMSGGERQRLAVARALYAQRPIIILDEGTSALDSVTEEALLAAIHGVDDSQTVIIVAHRLQTLRRCDRVVVVEDGRITAAAPFDELEHTHPLFTASLAPWTNPLSAPPATSTVE